MNALGFLVLLLVIAVPLAWLASEFQDRRWLRVILGSLGILQCVGVAFLVGSLDRFNSNAWFGGASKKLIDTTIAELERGNNDRVLQSLKKLQQKYSPTYENRARYDHLVEETVAEMQSSAGKGSQP